MNRIMLVCLLVCILYTNSTFASEIEGLTNSGRGSETNSYVRSSVTGTITGKVTSPTNKPLEATSVKFPQLMRGTISDKGGGYRISDLPTGAYIIVFSRLGYVPETRKVNILRGETVHLNIVLESTLIEMQPVVVTGTPYISDILTTSADIDALAGREKTTRETSALGESLDRLSGITSIATGSQVGKPVIRGLSSNRIRILTDGISMDYQQYGVRHWANVDPFTAERIEVVRGASSVLYGSDALGGVINVISKRIPNAVDEYSFIRGRIISQYFTNNNEVLGGVKLEGASGGFGFAGTILKRSGDNIHVPDVKTANETGKGTDPKFTGELDHTDFDQLNGSLSIGYQSHFGKVEANYVRWNNEHNFLLPDGKGIGQNLENDQFQVKGLFHFGNNWILRPTFSYLQNLRQSNKEGSTRDKLTDDIVIDLLLKTYTSRLELEHGQMGLFTGQLGMEYMFEDQETRGEVPLTPTAEIYNFAGFVFEEAELGNFNLSLGMRFDSRKQKVEPNEKMKLPDYDAGESDDVLKQTYSVFSSSIGGSYRFSKNLALAANIGRGFRAPSVFELHVYGEHGGIAAFQIGDPEMKEEISLNTDISIRWRSPRFQVKASLYRNAIDNYIYLYNTGEIHSESGKPIMRSTQVDAQLIGADLSIQAQLLSWLQLRGTFETVEGENADTDEKLPLLPATKAESEVRFTQRKWKTLENLYLGFGTRHSAKKDAAGRYEPFWQFDGNPNFGVASTDAYILFDLELGFDFPLQTQYVNFDLLVKNLLDEEYRDFLDTYKGYALSPGRNVILKLSIPFEIVID